MMHEGWAGGGWLVGLVVMIVMVGLVVWLVLTLTQRPGGRADATQSAQEILADRFARGELDVQEYEERRRALAARR